MGRARQLPDDAVRRRDSDTGAVMIRWLVVASLFAAGVAPDSFEATWQRLKDGRPYSAEKTGTFSIDYPAGNGVAFENVVEVPADYTPARKWPLRVQLHGGVA